MSGWDVSSTPSWGPQDGPEDTQAFPGQGDGSRDFGSQDFGRGGPGSPPSGFPEAGGGFPGESAAGGPPPEFFGQEYSHDDEIGPGGFPQRTPGRSLQDLPRRETRGKHSSVPGGGGGYGQEGGYGQDNGFGQEGGFGQEAGYGHDNGYGQESGAYGQDSARGQDSAFAQDSAYGQDWGGSGGAGQPDSWGGNGNGTGGQPESWGGTGGTRQPDSWSGNGNGNGQPDSWGGSSNGNGQPESWGPGGAHDNDGGWGRAPGRSAAPWEGRPQPDPGYPAPDGPGYPGPDGQDFGQQDFGRQDYTRQAPRPDFAAQDYEGQDFPGQQGHPPEPGGFERGDRDVAARMDPALQDFFVPQRGGTPGYPGPGPGSGPGRPGEPRDPRFRPPTDGWEGPGRSQPPRNGTGPRPLPRGPRRDDPEPRRGLGARGFIAIGAVVAVIIVIAVVVLTHKSGGSTPAASTTPTGGTASTAAAKPSASKAAGSGAGAGTPTKAPTGGTGAAAAAYTLSTPATAGGYPKGQDPHFLATAQGTATQIKTAVTSGGGGTVKGDSVSAAYQLPANQVITFVGYQGTFTPAKVATILAALGSNPHAYPGGPNGGQIGCANTKTAPEGAVCVWATSSTLGITEFFTATGPETLNAAQSKGADDTLKLRADVEKKS